MFGLTSEQFSFIDQQVVKPLEAKACRVFCYGSRARGDHKTFSDLDLMIEGEVSLEIEKILSEMRERLTESNFPIKVEIVRLDQFAAAYKAGYEQDKVKW